MHRDVTDLLAAHWLISRKAQVCLSQRSVVAPVLKVLSSVVYLAGAREVTSLP